MADNIQQQKTINELRSEYKSINKEILKTLRDQRDQTDFTDKILNKIFRTESQINKLYIDRTQNGKGLTKEQLKQKKLDAEAIDASQKILRDIKGRLKGFNNLAKQAKRFNIIAKANPYVLLASIILGIVGSLVAIAKAAENTASQFGVTRFEATKINAKLLLARATITGFSITAEEAEAAFVSIGEQLGGIGNASISLIKSVAQTAKQTGLTAEEFATVLSLQESISKASRESLINQIKLTREQINLRGVGAAAIFKDIAENTEFFATFAKQGGKNIEEAAVQARKLGLSLTESAKITESLLDFETSIEKQLEASLLLGREINFDRARQAAFQGDISSAIAEIQSQLGGEAEIAGLDPIAKQAVADAVGLSVSELGKLTREQEGENAEEFKTASEIQTEKMDKQISLLTDIRDDTKLTKIHTKNTSDGISDVAG